MGRADHWPSNNAATSEDAHNREKTVPHHAQKQTTRTIIHIQRSGIPHVTAPQSSHQPLDNTPEAEGHVLTKVTNFQLRAAWSTNTRHKHVKLDLTCTSHVSQQYHNASDGIHSVPHLHGIKSRKRQIDEDKTHKYGSSNHYRRWIHSIVQSHSQERERREKQAKRQYQKFVH